VSQPCDTVQTSAKVPFAKLALAETWDNGKPIRETTAADIPLAIDHFRYFAGAIRAQEGSISEIDHDTVAYHFHEPLGVVGQIIPWNFPILMAVWKLAPGARRRQLRGAEAGRADPGLDPGPPN
jgi:acyl-CoA reductase-like NAD-dependent aldehyde dehydrogenase